MPSITIKIKIILYIFRREQKKRQKLLCAFYASSGLPIVRLIDFVSIYWVTLFNMDKVLLKRILCWKLSHSLLSFCDKLLDLLFRALRSFPPPFYHLYFSISLSFNISNGYNSIKIWLKRLIPVSKWLFSWMNSKKKLYRNNRKERKKFRRKRAHYEPEKQMIPVEKLLNEHIQFTSIVEECKRKTKKQITVIKCTRIPKWKGK